MAIYGVFDPRSFEQDLAPTIEKMGGVLNLGYNTEELITQGLGIGRTCSKTRTLEAQPIWNEDRTKFIFMTGQILDYETMREQLIRRGHRFRYLKNCADCILHGFEEWGARMVEMLNGIFVFVVYDTDARTVTIANDRYGMKPFYFNFTKPRLTFASQVKAVIEDPDVRREINWDAWRDIFSYGYVLGDKTPFANVYRLPSASIITVAEDMKVRKYWSYTRTKVDHDDSEEYFVTEAARLIIQAVKRQCADLDKCIILLSGGYDSRCIASALKCYTEVNVETYTTLNPGAGIIDAELAKRVAKQLKVRNTFIPLPNDLVERHLIKKVFLLDGMSTEHLWILPLVDELESGRINLDGLAGDILLKGLYLTDENIRHADDLEELASQLHQEMMIRNGIPSTILVDLFRSPVREKLKPRMGSVLEELTAIGKHENITTIFMISNRTRNAISLNPNNIIATKAQCFFPFLDNDLVAFSLTVPPMMKFGQEIYRKALRRLFPDVMKIPSTNVKLRHPLQDPIATMRYIAAGGAVSKLKASITRRWRVLQGKHNKAKIDYLRDLLGKLAIPAAIDPEALDRTIHNYVNGNKDPSPFLVPLLEFCLWYNLFCEPTQAVN